jgi:uncharacterized protein (TIGR02265 family)
MAKVKGTILVDFAKTIRADKSGAYAAYLTDQDRKIIADRILVSSWYPLETFKHCFQAVVTVLAKNDMEKVHQWGRLYGEHIITTVYKGIVKQGAPLESLQKYSSYIRNLFDFGAIEIKPLSDHEALIVIHDLDFDFEPQYHMMRGWLERSIELCGAKNIKTQTVSKAWEGAAQTSFKISWTPGT